jgi:hypothetical protein
VVGIIFSSIVIMHALIHLIGFGKASQISGPENFSVKKTIASSQIKLNLKGLLWWLCFIGLVLSIIFYRLGKDWWWIIAIGPAFLSQILIMQNWSAAKWGSAVNVTILLGILLSYHHWKFDRMVKNEVHKLLNSVNKVNASIILPESIEGLPAIVQTWLRRSNVIGKEKISTVYLTQKGRMQTKPDATWMHFEAEQYFTTSSPGFIWNVSVDAGNFITIAGRDKYVMGHGNMLIKAMNLIPIANKSGKEIDQGTMLRYLVEMSWFPSAALNDYLTWEPVDETSARAIMRDGDITVSGIFSFNSKGDIIGFEAKRYRDFNGKYSLETWSIRMTGYKIFNDIRIPNKSEVTWKLEAGDFTWLEVEVTDIAYNAPH